MDGIQEHTFPTGSKYVGEIKDGLFHGKGVLHFANRNRYEATWENGRAKQGSLFFADGLQYQETNWDYCIGQNGLFYGESPTNLALPRVIPDRCYDCGDGFYDPSTRVVTSYAGRFLRNADDSEHVWILRTCRKAWDEAAVHPENSFPTQAEEN